METKEKIKKHQGFTQRLFLNSKISAGFTLVEIVVSLAIFAILASGMLGAISVLSRISKQNREKVVLSSLAVNYMEIVKNMPYSDVGTVTGNPTGSLPDLTNAASSTVEGVLYKIYYEVTYIDDPADGSFPADVSASDYKQVKMNILNTRSGAVTNFVTNVVPKGLEDTTNAGALRVRVFDSVGQPISGVNVRIESTSSAPSIILDRTTDSGGQWVEVGLPPRANSYHIVVSKTGYSSDQTYPITAQNPNPYKPDSTVVAGQITDVSFSIDIGGNLSIRTLNEICQPINGINLNVRGAKLTGVNSSIYKYDNNFTSAAGVVSLTGLEWDTYTPALLSGQPWAVRGTSPIQKIDVLPGSSQTFTMILGSGSSSPSVGPSGWYSDWGYRRKITQDRTKISGGLNLTNFPVLVSLSGADYKSVANGGKVQSSSGNDFLFTASDGLTKLDFEIEQYDPVSGALLAWVRIPTLNAAANTEFYVYYGKASVSAQANPSGVWGAASFQGVWHNSDTGTTFYDSTGNDFDAQANIGYGPTSSSAGKIGKALSFDGVQDYGFLPINNANITTQSFTLSAWVKTSRNSSNILHKMTWNGLGSGYIWNLDSSGRMRLFLSAAANGGTSRMFSSNSTSVTNNVWRYINVVRNVGSNVQFYVDGALVATDSSSQSGSLSNNLNFFFGREDFVYVPTNRFLGLQDEVRVAFAQRSSQWIGTEYNNQNSPGTFVSVGSEEAYVPPAADSSLLVVVKDSASSSALEGAAVHLEKTLAPTASYDAITGGSVWTQSSWQGGSGQADWLGGSVDRYFQSDGNTDVTVSPVGVRLKQTAGIYSLSGWLESSTFDTGTASTSFTTISWQPTSQTASTTLKFQLAANNDNSTWDYIGPDGTASSYFTVPGTNVPASLSNKQFVRYKVYLSTIDTSVTPVLTSLNINYVSGCYTPGQVFFGGLLPGTFYSLEVTLPGYQTYNEPSINIYGNQVIEVLMSP